MTGGKARLALLGGFIQKWVWPEFVEAKFQRMFGLQGLRPVCTELALQSAQRLAICGLCSGIASVRAPTGMVLSLLSLLYLGKTTPTVQQHIAMAR